MAKQKSGPGSSTIALNKKARHDYFIEDRIEAGLSLQGWEVKSLREGRVQLSESYILLRENEAWLFGMHISPLLSASTHVTPDAMPRCRCDRPRGARLFVPLPVRGPW